MPRPPLFRQESLEKLAVPDELDRPFTVVRLIMWLPLIVLSALCGLAVAWAFVGRIPETVDGAGVLINPGQVRPLQIPFGGQIVEVRVRPGHHVEADEVLAVVNHPKLRQRLLQAKARFRELKKTDENQRRLDGLRLEQAQVLREAEEKILGQSIRQTEDFLKKFAAATKSVAMVRRQKLLQSRKDVSELNQTLKKQLESVRRLSQKNMVTMDTLMQAEATLLNSNLQLANLDAKLAALDLSDLENGQALFQKRTRIANLGLQMQQLQLKATSLTQEISQGQATRTNGLHLQQNEIHQLELLLEQHSFVKSPHAGRVLEVSVQAGHITEPGARIGSIEITESTSAPSATLKNLAYFPVKSGKWIQPGMRVHVTPTAVQRERFGSIIGRVTRVSPFPITAQATASLVGNPEIVRDLLKPGSMIEVEVELERADTPSGFRWTSAGPPLQFSPGTTTRVRVTVEERAPITFLMPILRSWMYGKGDDK